MTLLKEMPNSHEMPLYKQLPHVGATFLRRYAKKKDVGYAIMFG